MLCWAAREANSCTTSFSRRFQIKRAPRHLAVEAKRGLCDVSHALQLAGRNADQFLRLRRKFVHLQQVKDVGQAPPAGC